MRQAVAFVVAILVMLGVLLGPSATADVIFPGQFGEATEKRSDVRAKIVPDSLAVHGNLLLAHHEGSFDSFSQGGLNLVPRQLLTEAVVGHQGDDFDFVLVLTRFPVDLRVEDALADGIYFHVRNDVEGIGLLQFDHGADWGSAGRLQGYIDLGQATDARIAPGSVGYQRLLETASHELMHRWSSYVRYRDGNGELRDDLLGFMGSHWHSLVDSNASVMYGHRWSPIAPGEFLSGPVRRTYSQLDLYLAGLLAAEEVGDILVLRNPDIAPPELPQPQLRLMAEASHVPVQGIVAAEGARSPGTLLSQKHFRAALVVLSRPGDVPEPGFLQAVEQFRRDLQQRFALMTLGRAVLHIVPNGSVPGRPGAPEILEGSAISGGSEADIESALSWIEQARSSSGMWSDRAGSRGRDTAWALSVLRSLRPTSEVVSTAESVLAGMSAPTVETLAWRQRGLGASPTQEAVDALLALHRPDGGWGVARNHASSVEDTAQVLLAFADHLPPQVAADAFGFLLAAQRDDGAWGHHAGGAAHFAPTLSALEALALSTAGGTQALSAGQAWLIQTHRTNGTFRQGEDLFGLGDTARAVRVLFGSDAPPSLFSSTRLHLVSHQGQAGDWGGSIFATAAVVEVLAGLERPNLRIIGQPFAVPDSPVEGAQIRLSARIGNSGNQMAAGSQARWYLGDPRTGGSPLSGPLAVPPLQPGSSVLLRHFLDTAGLEGAHAIWIVADDALEIEEVTRTDNYASFVLEFSAPPTGPDLALHPDALAVSPPTIASLPTEVRVTGQIWNLGNTGVSSARLELHDVGAAIPVVLAALDIPLPARSQAPFDFGFGFDGQGSGQLRLVADPQQHVADADRSNNAVDLSLQVLSGVDVAVEAIQLLPAAALVAGRPLSLSVEVANRGLSTAPPFLLDVAVLDNAGSTLFEDSVQISLDAASGTVRTFPWVAPAAGTYVLRAHADAAGMLDDVDPGNNFREMSVEIAEASGINLRLDPVSVEDTPRPALQGQAYTVSATIHAEGAQASPPFSLGLYLDDPRSGAAVIGEARHLDPLLPGQSQVLSVVVDNLSLAGPHTLWLKADAHDEIEESDSVDNLAVIGIDALSLPDLAIQAEEIALSPSTPVAGEPVAVEVRVHNLGRQSAHGVRVDLYEANEGFESLVFSQWIDELPGESFASLQWSWILAELGNPDRIRLRVDPEGAIVEQRTDNNQAEYPLAAGDGPLFPSNRYFSPNGDGIKDDTLLVFRFADPVAFTVSIDAEGEVVRQFDAHASTPIDRGHLRWDGRDAFGRVVVDGDYRVRLLAGATELASTVVTVDTNRAPLVGAQSRGRLLVNRIDGHRQGALEPVAFDDTRLGPGLLLADPDASSADGELVRLRGLYRSGLRGIDPVISSIWVDRRRAERGAALAPQAIAVDAEGGRVAVLATAGDVRDLWIANLRGVDEVRAIALPTASGDIHLAGFAPTGAAVVLTAAGPYPRMQVHSVARGAQVAVPGGVLSWARNDAWQLGLMRDGVASIRRDQGGLHLASFDGSSSEIDVPGSAAARFRRIEVSPSGRWLALHRLDAASEAVDRIDPGSQVVTTLAEVERVTQHCYEVILPGGAFIDAFAFAAAWSPTQDHLAIVDAEASTLRLFGAEGLIEDIALPTQPGGSYAGEVATTGVPLIKLRSLRAVQRVDRQPSKVLRRDTLDGLDWQCSSQGGWSSGKSAADPDPESGPAFRRGLLWDETGSRVLFVLGDLIESRIGPNEWGGLALAFGRTQAIELDIPRKRTRILDQGSQWTYQGQVGEPLVPEYDHYGSHFDAPGSYAPRRLWWWSAGRAQPWMEPFGPYRVARIWEGERGYALDEEDCEGCLPVLVANLDRGTALLQSRMLGSSLDLSGLATDRDLRAWRIDVLAEQEGAEWRQVTGWSGAEVEDERFLRWPSNLAGPLLLRLETEDRAGNRLQSQRRVVVPAANVRPLELLSANPRDISPNGDGIQDALILEYRALIAQASLLRAIDAMGQIVHEQVINHLPGDLGDHLAEWSGVTTGGLRVPDGRYDVDLWQYSVPVNVDTEPPLAEVSVPVPQYFLNPQLGDTLRPNPSTTFSVYIADASPFSATLESRPWTSVSGWVERGAPSDWSRVAVRAEEFAAHAFRVRVDDQAGNRTVAPVPWHGDRLLLIAASSDERVEEIAEGLEAGAELAQDAFSSWTRIATPLTAADFEPDAWATAVQLPAMRLDPEWGLDLHLRDLTRSGIVELHVESRTINSPWVSWEVEADGPRSRTARIPSDALPGALVHVRLRGRTSEGTELISNTLALRLELLEGPVCWDTIKHSPFFPGGLDGQVNVFWRAYAFGGFVARELHVVPRDGPRQLLAPRGQGALGAEAYFVPFAESGTRVEALLVLADGREVRFDGLRCPGTDDPDEWQVPIHVATVPAAECGSRAGEIVARVEPVQAAHPFPAGEMPQVARARAELRTAGGQALHTLFDVLDPQPQPLDFTECERGGHLVQASLPLDSLPAGGYTLAVAVELSNGQVETRIEALDIHADPPPHELIAPPDQGLVCLEDGALPVSAAALDSRRSTLAATIRSVDPQGSVGPLMRREPATDVAHWWRCGQQSEDAPVVAFPAWHSSRNLLFERPHVPSPQLLHGLVDLRTVLIDRAGGRTCAVHRVQLDSRVEVDDARSRPVRPWSQFRSPVISHGGMPDFAEVEFAATVSEALTARLHVFRAYRNAQHEWQRESVPALVGEQVDIPAPPPWAPTGEEIALSWNGFLDSGPAEDGFYFLAPRFADGCRELEFDLGRLVEVDSTPPQIEILAPHAGQPIQTGLLAVTGTVDDKYFERYEVQLGLGVAPQTWQTIGAGQQAVREPGQLAISSIAGLAGPAMLRVSARDRLGNISEHEVAIELAPPPPLILAAAVHPMLFSPNGDGRLEESSVHFTLAVQAQATLRVVDAQGIEVAALLEAVPLSAGSHAVDWQGVDNSGSVATDGRYRFVLHVVNAQDPGHSDDVQVAVTVDTTPAHMEMLRPAGEFASGEEPILVRVVDLHPQRLDFELREASGSTIDQGEVLLDANMQAYELSPLGELPEGSFALLLHAVDRAENHSAQEHAFTIDRTPPEIELHNPEAGAHLRPGTSIEVTGIVTDSHLSHWQLHLAEHAADPDWLLLSASSIAPEGELLADWLVDLPDGDYRLRLQARDHAGNESEIVHDIVVDGTPPQVVIDTPAAHAWSGPQIEVAGTIEDLHLHDFSLFAASRADAAAGMWTEVMTGTEGVEDDAIATLDPALPGGEASLRIEATDRAGNQTVVVRDFLFVPGPPAAPQGLTANVENRDQVRLAWQQVESPVPLAGYRLYRNGVELVAVGPGTLQHLDIALVDGSYRYTVTALDVAGGESEHSAPAFATIRLIAPEVAIHVPATAERVRGIVEVIGTAHSEEGFAGYSLSAQTLGGGTAVMVAQSSNPRRGELLGNWDTRIHANESQVRLRLEAGDSFGNGAETEVVVVVDNLAPEAPLALTATVSGEDVLLGWSAGSAPDLLGYLLYRNGDLVNWEGSLPADLRPLALQATDYLDRDVPDGSHEYRVFAIDLAGNISPPSNPALVELDRRPPSLQFIEPLEGHVFETSVRITVDSPDLDIATVQMDFRDVDGGAWQALGGALTQRPYRITWVPESLPLGEYEIRAIATDLGGLVDPQPPILRVRHADLTPPAVPTGLGATTDGDQVELAWQPVADGDLDGYFVYRDTLRLNAEPLQGTTYLDTAVPLGVRSYRVQAVDQNGNHSDRSDEVAARVFRPVLEQPYTPTPEPTTTLSGSSPVVGDVVIDRIDADGETGLGSWPIDVSGSYLVESPLLPGLTDFSVRVEDHAGNRSLPAMATLRHRLPPAAPTGLDAQLAGHDVHLHWDVHPDPVVIGYRLFRNGVAEPADVHAPAPAESLASSGIPGRAFDGNPATSWGSNEFHPIEPENLWIEARYAQSQLLTAMEFDWSGSERRAVDFDILGWDGVVWVPLKRIRGNVAISHTEQLPRTYRSDRFRVRILRLTWSGWGSLGLSGLRLQVRPLLADAEWHGSGLLDGSYRFEVSAVDDYGFESPRSAPLDLDVGDTTPPPPVELQAVVDGADVLLSWTASDAGDLHHYRLLRDDVLIATVPAGEPRQHLDADLLNGIYAYHVRAVDEVGNASVPSNSVVVEIAMASPPAPRNLQVSAPIEGAALDLSWEPGEGSAAVGYRINRSTVSGGPYIVATETAALGLRDQPLQNGVAYFYTVQALDELGNASAPSTEASGVPMRLLPPPTPAFLWPGLAGETVHSDAAFAQVRGSAVPAVRVDLYRESQLLASTEAVAAATSTLRHQMQVGTNAARISDDGRWLYIIDNSSGSSLLHAFEGEVREAPGSCRFRSWDTLSMHLWRTFWDSSLHVLSAATGESETLATPMAVLNHALPSPGGVVAILGGRPTAGAPLAHFLWEPGSPTLDPLPQIPYATALPERMAWSPQGDYLAWIASGNLNLFSLDDGSVHVAATGVANGRPSWSADGSRVAAHRTQAGTAFAIVVEVATGAVLERALVDSQALHLALDAAGVRLAYASSSHVRVVDLDGGAVAFNFDVGSGGRALAWSAEHELVWVESQRVRNLTLPGAFRFDAVPLNPGANPLHLRAVDDHGNGSAGSGVLNVMRASAHLPDLSIIAGDLRVLPAAGEPGEAFALRATVRNIGDGPSPPADVLMHVVERTSNRETADTVMVLPALAPGASATLAWHFGVVDTAGPYEAGIEIDPLQHLQEARRDNNRAVRAFIVDGGTLPRLFVDIQSERLSPGDVLDARLQVYNPGPAFNGHVDLSITDAAGQVVASLGRETIAGLAHGAVWHRAVHWPSGNTLAGAYQLQASLYASHGALLEEVESEFEIVLQANVALVVAPQQPTYVAGGEAQIQTELHVLQSNGLLRNAQLVLSALDANGIEVFQRSRNLGHLAPGYMASETVRWELFDVTPGDYVLRLRFTSGSIVRVEVADLAVAAAELVEGLTGSVDFADSPMLPGSAPRLNWQVLSTHAASSLPVRLRIARMQGMTTLATWTGAIDLVPGQIHSAWQEFPESILGLGDFIAVLEAQPSGATDWQVLAARSTSVQDRLPPTIDLLHPAQHAVVRSPLTVRARIVDAHSAIAFAESRGGTAAPWRNLYDNGQGEYTRSLSGLEEGPAQLVVRAGDSAGNVAVTAPRDFVVDNTPPLIIVTGVADGDILNHGVAPEIEVMDPHLDEVEILLNGSDYLSGAGVDLEGVYELFVRASDLAGNVAQRLIRFEIDMTAPTLAITEPADGAEVDAPRIAVTVETEAHARVQMTTAGYQDERDADASGLAHFLDVPLELGVNTIDASATDAAGNVGTAQPVSVTRVSAPHTLIGTLIPQAAEFPADAPVAGTWQIANPGSTDVDGIPVRVRAWQGSEPEPLDEQAAVVDIAAGEVESAAWTFDSAGWALGDVLLTLEVEVEGGWLSLDAMSVLRSDRTPPLLSALAPMPGATHGAEVVVMAAASDLHSAVVAVEVSLDGGAWLSLAAVAGQPDTYSRTLSALTEGPRSLRLRAIDEWNNQSQTAPIEFLVDITPPQITISGVNAGASYPHAVTPTYTVTDASSFEQQAWLNEEAFTSGTSVDSEGTYLLRVLAEDVAGNVGEAQLAFEIDLTPPTLEFTHPAPDAVLLVPQVLLSGLTEPAAQVHLLGPLGSVQVQADVDGSFQVPEWPLAPGINLVSGQPVDRAGNVGDSVEISIEYRANAGVSLIGTVAFQPPSFEPGSTAELALGVTNPGATPAFALPLRVEVRALTRGGGPLLVHEWTQDLDGDETFETSLSIESASWPLGAVAADLSAFLTGTDGAQAWVVLASTQGNVVDLSPPELAWIAPANGSYHGGDVEVAATATDALSAVAEVSVRVGDGVWRILLADPDGMTWRGQLDLDEGTHALQTRAADSHGNQVVDGPRSVHVDRTPPQIDVEGVTDGHVGNQPVTIIWSVSDVSPVTSAATLNGMPFASGDSVSAEGDHVLAIVAEDAAGNVASVDLEFSLDMTPPPLVVHHPAQGQVMWQPTTAVIGATEPHATVDLDAGSGAQQVTATADGGFLFKTVTLEPGLNTLALRATDRAGNASATLQLSLWLGTPGDLDFDVAFDLPQPEWTAGAEPAPFAVHVINTGEFDLEDSAFEIDVVAVGRGEALAHWTFTAAIAVGEGVTFSGAWTTTNASPGDYRFRLRAALPDGEGGLIWRALGDAEMLLADREPPEVEMLMPGNGDFVAPGDRVRIRAFDRLSAVAGVAFRINGDTWIDAFPDGEDTYVAVLPALGDGAHLLQARAVDLWDNVGMSAPVTVRGGSTLPNAVPIPSSTPLGWLLLGLLLVASGAAAVRSTRSAA